ncbi:MAG: bifunctional phosphoribosyl-AMP cyclohydrolase/phosphoribosyl-ATP diphosphatase HisIE [Candidatus Bathyarchaeota archaeon]|nr:bifunctional phosphoribosyl-AMP cyclohydrolase/phosphoribosyl-ATP diphosphatase HisIE [Candidatus Bathyarchaeota archaeon]MDH5532219.1 bifunctional phosphoribosyl-AMP cyclohydrolase/phosphoribosyl-ATP diphosphatase HisIE [Candidatus Bathyarchaeota archaeon]MDH5712756.1 bifunctional phosphoribosyl-AMP cyclohydrolase/phosphoribosyl-ATP diphosphatase HisIE [Candidatus Bathyarchaeota archaeon]
MVLQLSEAEAEKFVEKVNFEKMNGLVPVVVQDSSNDRVLTQAFMNRQALQLTLTSGKMHYWSRTRKRIWLKGEESGHHSLLQNAILDCDNDAILFKVQQVGVCCHTGQESCFHNPIIAEKELAVDAKILERIYEVVVDRIKNPTERSYVSRLHKKGEDAILQKIGEETTELVLAVKANQPEEIVHEATDILFFILVLFAQKNLRLQEIFKQLENRHREKTR